MCNDVFLKQVAHRGFLPEEQHALEAFSEQALQVRCQDGEAEEHTQQDEEEDLQHQVELKLKHGFGQEVVD